MHKLTPPDSHYLNAAAGWLELGNTAEARLEWQKISVTNRNHPAALELEWQICAAGKDWPSALVAAQKLVRLDPENVSNWIHQSYSLHEMKRTHAALDCLLPIIEKFPGVSTIPYNLACYACQLGDLGQARNWLAKAVKIRGKEDIRKVALTDADLLPLWEEINKF
jgi:tetratricopeptide (TPR) repeat protein